MRKRLRKKLRLREFVELAFTAKYQVKPGLSPDALESLLDRFILPRLCQRAKECNGGGLPAGAHVARRPGNITDVFVGDLQDAWHVDAYEYEKPPAHTQLPPVVTTVV